LQSTRIARTKDFAETITVRNDPIRIEELHMIEEIEDFTAKFERTPWG
jgi:hypothetical protein